MTSIYTIKRQDITKRYGIFARARGRESGSRVILAAQNFLWPMRRRELARPGPQRVSRTPDHWRGSLRNTCNRRHGHRSLRRRANNDRASMRRSSRTGLRRGDAARVGMEHVHDLPGDATLRGRRMRSATISRLISLTTEKTGVDVNIPIFPALQEALDAGALEPPHVRCDGAGTSVRQGELWQMVLRRLPQGWHHPRGQQRRNRAPPTPARPTANASQKRVSASLSPDPRANPIPSPCF